MGATDGIVHGALDHAELAALGVRPEALIDFSSNLNPFGPPEAVRRALAALDPAPYPDRSCLALRHALAARHGCPIEQILVGNGANELIHLLARALLHPSDPVLVLGPTYGEYAHTCRLAGAHVVELLAHPADDFRHDAEALTTIVSRLRPRLTWLCTPNNPTGTAYDPAAIGRLAEQVASTGGLLIVDRAYTALRRDGGIDALPTRPSLLELHSLTKSYALAGLRLGYLLGDPALLERVGAYQPTWSVNSAAQAAGLAALSDAAFLPATIPQLWAASDALCADLHALGCTVRRATLPFFLVHTGNGAATRQTLLRRGCLVRDCASFGLAEWVRIAPQRPERNRQFVAVWEA